MAMLLPAVSLSLPPDYWPKAERASASLSMQPVLPGKPYHREDFIAFHEFMRSS